MTRKKWREQREESSEKQRNWQRSESKGEL